MKKLFYLHFAGLLAISSSILFSSDAFLLPTTYEKINDHLYKVVVDAGDYTVNSIISAGPDGVLFVDSGLRQSIPEYKRILKELGLDDPSVIINSHFHIDHTGGNIEFGKDARVYGHPTIKTRLTSPRYAMYGFTDDAFPDELITRPKALSWNGDRIWIIPLEGSHSGSDLAIYFEESDIAYLGDLAYGMMLPSVDRTDGDATLYPKMIQKALESIGKETRVISGHGKDCSVDEMRFYRMMLERSINTVSSQIDDGMSSEEITSNGSMDDFVVYANDEYTPVSGWVDYIYNGKNDIASTPRAADVVYPVLRDRGVKAAIKMFEELEQDKNCKYACDALTFYVLVVNYLQPEGEHKKAIAMAEYAISKYPDWTYNWIMLDAIAGSYHEMNKNKKAVKFYKASLAQNPDNRNAVKHLNELNGLSG